MRPKLAQPTSLYCLQGTPPPNLHAMKLMD
jgi:hypothetical protein